MNMTPNISDEVSSKRVWRSVCCLTMRRCVMLVAVCEIIGSLVGVGVLSYASYTFPQLKRFMLLPPNFSDALIVGLLNGWAILCGLEFFLGLMLLDGAKNIKLGQLRFWLTSMFTYEVVTCSLTIGIEMGGFKAMSFNSFIISTIFLRFAEFIGVFIFLEDETLKRMRLKTRSIREAFSNATSCSNISVGDIGNDDNLESVVVPVTAQTDIDHPEQDAI